MNLPELVKVSVTPQTVLPKNPPALMIKNNSGGFVFGLSAKKQLDRFLILGCASNKITKTSSETLGSNTKDICKLIKEDGEYVVSKLVEISNSGVAKNNDYALMVLALCFAHGSASTKALSKEALLKVARTGTHLMHFVGFAKELRGWGSSLKKAVANWYLSKSPDNLAYQAVKYQSRDGWSQVDIIRLSHPKTTDAKKQSVLRYIAKGYSALTKEDVTPNIIHAFEEAKTASIPTLLKLITDNRMSMEMVPTESRNLPEVWEALVPHMSATALIRNLNKMTSVGLIKPGSETSDLIINRLSSNYWMRSARIHPLQLLVANKVYDLGEGVKGSLSWVPDPKVTRALEDAFYLSFDFIDPSGKNIFKAIDVSGSMNQPCSGASVITCREAAAVLAMVSARVEENSVIYGFDHTFRDLGITKSDDLKTVCLKTYSSRFSSTDCSAPILYAKRNNLSVDQFEIYTDNETYYGVIHPFEAMEEYRVHSKINNSKMAVIAMSGGNFTIANPKDSNMIDLVGFDTATPAILSDFASGYI